MSHRAKRTIRARIVDPAGNVVHETVVNSKALKVLREMTDPKYRVEISPAPDWEEIGRWNELRDRLR